MGTRVLQGSVSVWIYLSRPSEIGNNGELISKRAHSCQKFTFQPITSSIPELHLLGESLHPSCYDLAILEG